MNGWILITIWQIQSRSGHCDKYFVPLDGFEAHYGPTLKQVQ